MVLVGSRCVSVVHGGSCLILLVCPWWFLVVLGGSWFLLFLGGFWWFLSGSWLFLVVLVVLEGSWWFLVALFCLFGVLGGFW